MIPWDLWQSVLMATSAIEVKHSCVSTVNRLHIFVIPSVDDELEALDYGICNPKHTFQVLQNSGELSRLQP